jgi:NAD(P)-dependent dehydrogenase (short-subunit alcohol dehydrogenase family)
LVPGKDFRLDGRVAAVTGGGSGIGRAIALKFAAYGATIRVLDVSQKDAEIVCLHIRDAGGNASAHACDVTARNRCNPRSQNVSSMSGSRFW